MGRVIHTGQALVDETVEVGRLPRRGANEMAASYARAAGGAVNILLAAVRQGASTVHAGAHGRGSNGDLIREALEAEGVTLASAPVEELDTGICFVMVEPSAERTFVTTLGAERRLTVEMLTASEPVAGDLVCVTGYSLAVASTREPLLEWLATLASGVSVVLDPGDAFAGLDARLRETMLGLTSVWTGNQEESSALTGKTGMAAAAASVVRMLGDGEGPGRVAIVRDGPRGCAVAIGGEVTEVAGFPQRPVDTNGAGDAHTGVLVAGVAAGLGWVEAARRANAGAALKVTRRGPATAPTAAEIDEFLSRFSVL